MIRLKVCGIKRIEDALEAARLGYDALGFIFASSPRQITPQQAKAIINRLPPFIIRVGVFVNASKEKIIEVANYCGLDAIQLHGDEDPDFCQALKGFRLIKALRIRNEDDIKLIANYPVNAILLDSYQEDKFGGTGKTFNWKLARLARQFKIPIILSGGLNPDNVAEAIKEVNPYGIDVCSGVEDAPGIKNRELLAKFLASAYKEEWGF